MRTRGWAYVIAVSVLVLLMGACRSGQAPAPVAPAPTTAAPAPAAAPTIAAPTSAPAPAAPAPAAPKPAAAALTAPQLIDAKAKELGVPLQLPKPVAVYAPKYGGKMDHAFYRMDIWDHMVTGFQPFEGSFIADTMVFFDLGPGTNPGDYTVKPWLAESWEVKDNGQTYVFHLRKGVKFGSNSKTKVDTTRDVTAQDWVDMMKIVFGEKTSRYLAQYPEISGPDSWKAIDNYTLEAKLNKPAAAFLYKLAVRGPALYSAQPVNERMAKESLQAAEALKGWPVHIGTGPWVVVEETEGVSSKYEKNPVHWRKDAKGNQLPFIDQIEYFQMQDERAQDAAFRTGKIAGLALDTCGVSTERYLDIQKSNPDTVWEIFPDSTNQRATLPTFKEGSPFHDIRIRRAMSLAVDKEGWVKSILGGWGFPWSTVLAPGNQYWLPPGQYGDFDGDGIPADKYLDYDLEAAKKLMEGTGFSPANPIKARYLLTKDLGNRFFSEAELQIEAIRKIGVEATIEVKDSAARRAAREAGDYDLMYWFPGFGWDPSAWFGLGYESKNTKNLFGPAGLSDPELDKMIADEESTGDPAQRVKKAQDIQRYLMEKQYYNMGAQWIMIVAIAPYLKNYQYHYVTPIGQGLAMAWIEK